MHLCLFIIIIMIIIILITTILIIILIIIILLLILLFALLLVMYFHLFSGHTPVSVKPINSIITATLLDSVLVAEYFTHTMFTNDC